ncbi:DUF2304 domain-containing protein [Saccharomonospora iraqiensis]|uniref:DUF2304 domain-containing protein n=1 Tax=Saccharomonospora iraqiensis TaxID=52698 RepID=UPI000419DCC2|nr:DUF2304 domain-containing protein [Saccharomonospora iraqiensis]
MWAQVVLLAAVAGIFLYFVSRRHNVRMQAGKRIGFFGFLAFAVYAVLFPGHVTLLAHALGIGRGADLLLYMLVVAFLFGMLNTYLRFRGTTQQITELARTLAIREAELVNHQRGVMRGEQVHSPVAATTAATAETTDMAETTDAAGATDMAGTTDSAVPAEDSVHPAEPGVETGTTEPTGAATDPAGAPTDTSAPVPVTTPENR